MGNSKESSSTGFSVRANTIPHILSNYLTQRLKCEVSKFDDDTNVATSIRYNDSCIKLQSGLDRLLGWTVKCNEF